MSVYIIVHFDRCAWQSGCFTGFLFLVMWPNHMSTCEFDAEQLASLLFFTLFPLIPKMLIYPWSKKWFFVTTDARPWILYQTANQFSGLPLQVSWTVTFFTRLLNCLFKWWLSSSIHHQTTERHSLILPAVIQLCFRPQHPLREFMRNTDVWTSENKQRQWWNMSVT